MLKICTIMLFGFCAAASAWAVDRAREEQALHLAREMIRTLYGFERVAPLPPAANAQVRVIVRKLVAESPADFQHAFFRAKDPQQSAFYSALAKHAGIGLLLCLIIFVIHAVVQKIHNARRNGKTDLSVSVHAMLQTAPYLLVVPMPSEAAANRIAQSLIADRLAARVDIFPQYFLSPNRDENIALCVTTVKGRLKTLKKRLNNLPISFPVSHGHSAYLTYIADAADGKADRGLRG